MSICNDFRPLRALGIAADLDVQIRFVQEDFVYMGGGGGKRFDCYITGDGKGMKAANHTKGKLCWLCDIWTLL